MTTATTSKLFGMKRFVKYIAWALLSCVCLLSCSKDPDVPIYDTIDFPQCLRPVNFKCEVLYVTVTVNLKAFPDAEAYELEAYSTDFRTLPEGEEPSQEDLVYQARITGDDLPYSFVGPDETTCYIRVRAVNETQKRKASEWVTGMVKTDVDPSTRCATPENVKVKANYNWVNCNLSTADNVKEYVLEIYSKAIPASGEPDAENLVQTVTKTPAEFPFTVKGVPAGTYYYRIQGRNEEAGLKPSKWVKGNFTTANYTWLDVEGSFDYNLAVDAKRETVFDQAKILEKLPSKTVAAGTTFEWDGITYGPSCSYSGDKFAFNRCKQWDSKTYAKSFPLECYESFKITRPGTVSFIPRASSKDEAKMPEVVIAILTNKSGEVSFDYVYQKKVVASENINTKNEANRLTIPISDEYLYGITEPATVYLFVNLNQIIVYPIKWTRTE